MPMIRRILCPAPTPDVAARGARCAASIAHGFAAEIEGLHIEPVPVPVVASEAFAGAPYTHEYLAALAQAGRERAEAARAAFEAEVKAAGAAFRWRSASGSAPYDYSAAARLGDLVVIGRGGPHGVLDPGLFEELVFQSARPVYAPAAGDAPRARDVVLLAWNGSREAARALSAGADFFAAARETHVVSVGDAGVAHAPLEGAVSLLRAHGARAHGEALDRRGDVEDTLLEYARARGAGLIVAGAWSHSRFRQIVLGGVTKRMIAQNEFDLLLAH